MAAQDNSPEKSESLAAFEAYRPYLFAVAYRMLGSAMDAEDMVQETYLRYQATPPETIISLKAFLTTIITRLCMDQLHLARRTREVYPGPWIPEPILTDDAAGVQADPTRKVELDESLSLAFLTLLEDLPPVERAVFLLREVFDYEYAEIAQFLDRSEVACRQSFSRAKKHLADHRPRFPVSPEIHRQMLDGFIQAAQSGDMAALMNTLTADVTLWADGGGKIPGAVQHPITGREPVARFVIGTSRRVPANTRLEVATINGQPAMIVRTEDGAPFIALTVESDGQQIARIRVIANPDKLTHLG